MEAAGIEPASSDLPEDDGEESDLAGPHAGRIASESSNEVALIDDDPRSERGPSEEPATPPGGAGVEPSG
jgi:hypothetical protein